MKNKTTLLFIAIFNLGFSIFSASAPSWVNDIASVYPKNQYFSALGYGKDTESARLNALGTLTQNIQSSVQVVTNSFLSEQQDESGKVSRNSSIEKSVQVASSLTLTGVDYTEPYFNKKKKLYYVGAFLENEMLFEQISVKAERPLKQMNSLLERAETMAKENDPFNSYSILKDAQSYADDFLSWYYIMYTADKKQAFSIYKKDVANAYNLPVIMKEYLSECLISIKSDTNFDKLNRDKFVSILKKSGFSIAGEGINTSKALYTADVKVILNLKTEGDGDDTLYVANPSISINLLNKDSILYTWTAESNEKIISYDKSNISKKCSSSISKLLDEYPIF
ncbi:MAG: LPP20 family lipoprotein [Treponema sp.]|nr:LPP20 family lipoprotein [Treponema sp.]